MRARCGLLGCSASRVRRLELLAQLLDQVVAQQGDPRGHQPLAGQYDEQGSAAKQPPGQHPTNWPAITTVTSGDNNLHTVTDTDAADVKFYSITAQ